MKELLQTWIARDCVVEINGEILGPFRLRPATAREALVVLGLQEDAAQGDDDAWAAAKDVLVEWLPLRLSSLLVRAVSWQTALSVAAGLLSVGLPEMKAQQQRVEARATAPRSSWSLIVAEYRAVMGGSLEEPWGFFLDQVLQVDRVKARSQLAFMDAYASVRSQKDAGRNRILQRAGLKEAWSEMDKEEKERMAERGLSNLKRQHDLYLKSNPMA